MQAIDKNGLKVNVGNSFNVRVAKASSSKEVVDFTKEGTTTMIFPSDLSLKEDTELIEQSLIGIPTSVKFLGKSTITGEINDITTPNGIAWYAKNTLGGVIENRENTKALISIETPSSFVIHIERENAVATKMSFIKNADSVCFEINLRENITVGEVIDMINSKEDFSAIILIGDGSEIFKLDDSKDLYVCHIIEHLFCGNLTEVYKKTIAKYVHIIIPKKGNANYFNMLIESKNANTSWLYTGARLLKLNMSYNNSALTTTSSSIWASAKAEFSGNATQAVIDDVKAAYSQTNGRTEVYSCGIKASSLSSLTNNFELSIEPAWNINNEAYEVPIEKYTDSYDFEMMFNEQSREIFERRVLENKNISVMILSETFLNGKQYKIIKYSKTLLGKPQYPTIADGVISLEASAFTSCANNYDPFTSTMIITSDIELEVNYTKERVKKDFLDWME